VTESPIRISPWARQTSACTPPICNPRSTAHVRRRLNEKQTAWRGGQTTNGAENVLGRTLQQAQRQIDLGPQPLQHPSLEPRVLAKLCEDNQATRDCEQNATENFPLRQRSATTKHDQAKKTTAHVQKHSRSSEQGKVGRTLESICSFSSHDLNCGWHSLLIAIAASSCIGAV
jgi:hypothetical protein